MRNGVSAIPKGMQAREFIGEVCVPALINAAAANSIKSVAFIRDLIDETLAEVFPNQQSIEPSSLKPCTCGRKDFCTAWCGEPS